MESKDYCPRLFYRNQLSSNWPLLLPKSFPTFINIPTLGINGELSLQIRQRQQNGEDKVICHRVNRRTNYPSQAQMMPVTCREPESVFVRRFSGFSSAAYFGKPSRLGHSPLCECCRMRLYPVISALN